MTRVRCKVNQCLFWEKGDHCTADEIWVRYSLSGDEDDALSNRIGLELGEDPLGGAFDAGVSSSQTCCETMQPKQGRNIAGSRGRDRDGDR